MVLQSSPQHAEPSQIFCDKNNVISKDELKARASSPAQHVVPRSELMKFFGCSRDDCIAWQNGLAAIGAPTADAGEIFAALDKNKDGEVQLGRCIYLLQAKPSN